MSALKIGKGVALPLSAVTSKAAILAMTGAGKTYLAKVIAEEMLDAGQRIAVFDYTGVWWGLTSSADGKRPGYNVVVFGGEHADVPLTEGMGALVADATVHEGISPIIDFSGFEYDAPKIRLATEFARRLYHSNRKPIHLFIDEADEFVPQTPRKLSGRTSRDDVPQDECLSAIRRIWQRGRVKGIGGSLISQRSALVSKSLLTQSETLIALRTVGPQDRAALELWFNAYGTEDQIDEFKRTIASLEKHHAWYWSPANDLFTIAKARTLKSFDSGRTPDAAIEIVEPKARTQHDIERLNKAFKTLAEEAKSNDPDVLKKQLAHYKEQFQVANKRVQILEERATRKAPDVSRAKPVRVPVITKPQEKAMRHAMKQLAKIRDDVNEALLQSAQRLAHDIEPAIKAWQDAFSKLDLAVSHHVAQKQAGNAAGVTGFPLQPAGDASAWGLRELRKFATVRPDGTRTRSFYTPEGAYRELEPTDPVPEGWRPAGATNGNGQASLTGGGPGRILAVLAQFGGRLPAKRVRVLAGIGKPTSFSTYLGRLKKAEYAYLEGSDLILTPEGRAKVGDVAVIPTGRAALEYWRHELGNGGERRIFDALVNESTTMIDRRKLMADAGIQNESSFSTYVGRLKVRGIVQVRGNLIGLDDGFNTLVQ